MKRTVQGAQIPEKSQNHHPCGPGGTTTPFFERRPLPLRSVPGPVRPGFDPPIRRTARKPNHSRQSYFLSFLALKLLGTERYAHVADHTFDPGLGAFAGLNVIPKCTALSTYSYSLDEVHLLRLQETLFNKAIGSALRRQDHQPRFPYGSPLWRRIRPSKSTGPGREGKTMKGALTLWAQDADTKLMLYTAADIRRSEAPDQVFAFLSFWKKVHRGLKPTLVFDSKFTGYAQLSKLNQPKHQIPHPATPRRKLNPAGRSADPRETNPYPSSQTKIPQPPGP